MKAREESEYDFTLILTGITPETDGVEDALFDAGCDDATFAFRSGRPVLTFARRGHSLKDAIISAIRDVRRTNLGADVLRVDGCNFVSLAEIARRIGRTRQVVHQYMRGQRGPGGFPGPVFELGEGIMAWSWCEVVDWLYEHDMIEQQARQNAQEINTINGILELEALRKQNAELTEEVQRHVGT